ncbi:hypothetical protein Droror1_Dr00027978 [Drosera rotundifolia]
MENVHCLLTLGSLPSYEELRIRCKKVLNTIRDAFKPEYGNAYNIIIKDVWKEYTGWPLIDMESEIYTETVRPFVSEANVVEYGMYEQALGPIHFVQKDNEMLITSQEDDVTPELQNSLFDTGRPNLVALSVAKLGRFCDNPSDGA